MRIDSTHRNWMVVTITALGGLGCAFILYAALSATRPGGGTIPGILFGIAGYALMIYAALLGVRKKVPVWRVGRAQTWMRGHLWLGFLTLPLILFHCGFHWRGPLAAVLMWLLFFTVGSGVLGAALQHFIPTFMTQSVPLETIYEEIPHIRKQLCEEADQLAGMVSATAEAEDGVQAEVDPEIRARFDGIYANTIRPVLSEQKAAPVGRATLASAFDSLRKILPADQHKIVTDLESICEEERQLRIQRRIYLYLHGWLLVHVPLSLALIVLGGVHAVIALRY